MREKMKLVEKPNLPQNKTAVAICGENPRLCQALRSVGIEAITVGQCGSLPEPLADHADMLCCHIAAGVLYTADGTLKERLAGHGVDCRTVKNPPGAVYPLDVPLNNLLIGDTYITRKQSCAAELLFEAEKNGYNILSVRQGYVRCSVAPVDERSVITADAGIARALENRSFDVLRIAAGGIKLAGYDYGFIGGSCFLRSKSEMLFFGDPLSHPDGERMLEFLNRKGVAAQSLFGGELFDMGGCIPLLEHEI